MAAKPKPKRKLLKGAKWLGRKLRALTRSGVQP